MYTHRPCPASAVWLCVAGVEAVSVTEQELRAKWEQALGPQYDVMVRHTHTHTSITHTST